MNLLPELQDRAFQELLASAKLGSHLDLTSAVFRLSVEQLEQLLAGSEGTQRGMVFVRGEDFDPIVLASLTSQYGPRLDIAWSKEVHF
ncbi:hypothetical protein ACQUJO_12310 [Ralstonia pseudosolanacearum]